MIHLLGLAVCAIVVAVSKVKLADERKVFDELKRKLTSEEPKPKAWTGSKDLN